MRIMLKKFLATNALSYAATPTAASAADQPTSLASLPVPLSRTLPAPYPPVHTSDTTNTSLA
jgi:hypothetical protein